MKDSPILEDAFHEYMEVSVRQRIQNSKSVTETTQIMGLFLNYNLFLSFLDELVDDNTDLDFENAEDLKSVLDMMYYSYEGYFESEEDWIAEKRKELGSDHENDDLSWDHLSDDETFVYLFVCRDSTRDGYHVFCGG